MASSLNSRVYVFLAHVISYPSQVGIILSFPTLHYLGGSSNEREMHERFSRPFANLVIQDYFFKNSSMTGASTFGF
jgi:hypothetical protein